MDDQPMGPVVDGLGVTVDLDDGCLVESALVLTKIVLGDGRVVVGMHASTGMDWLGQLALITAASKIIDDLPFVCDDDEDD